ISVNPIENLDPKDTSESTRKPLKRCRKEITSSTNTPVAEEQKLEEHINTPVAEEQKLEEQICTVSYAKCSFSSENVDDKEEEEEEWVTVYSCGRVLIETHLGRHLQNFDHDTSVLKLRLYHRS
ncbi:hypothetical protein MKX01_016603, partial [Papaver californicum]